MIKNMKLHLLLSLIVVSCSLLNHKHNQGQQCRTVLVRGGKFSMGGNRYFEKPKKEVIVDNFFLSIHEVTIKEFLLFLNSLQVSSDGILDNKELISLSSYSPYVYVDNKFEFKQTEISPNINCPAIYVTYYGALEYCEWVDGRLPTAEEWEFAASGGNQSKSFKYSGSNDPLLIGWFQENSGGKTHNVGMKMKNELGLYDMNGNVSEWISLENNALIVKEENDQKEINEIKGQVYGDNWATSAPTSGVKKYVSGPASKGAKYIGFRVAYDYKRN